MQPDTENQVSSSEPEPKRRSRAKEAPEQIPLGKKQTRYIIAQLRRLLKAPDLSTVEKVRVAGYIMELKRSLELRKRLRVKAENWLANQ
jgi:hypothetical protein